MTIELEPKMLTIGDPEVWPQFARRIGKPLTLKLRGKRASWNHLLDNPLGGPIGSVSLGFWLQQQQAVWERYYSSPPKNLYL